MFYHNLNPVLIKLGGLEIRYYGLMYVLGIGFAYWFYSWYPSRKKSKIPKEKLHDLLFWLVLGLLVGGRLGYCIFYNPAYYLQNPLEVLKIWEGGMSFHGGFILALLFGWLYCRKHRLNYLETADIVILPVPIGLMLGRIGNFINGELYGRPTSLPWGVFFPDSPQVARHPSQLYEAAKNLIIFLGLMMLERRKRKPGFLLFSFMLMYGLLRILIEFVREPEIVILGITMGQWLSIPLVLVGLFGVIRTWKRQ